MDVYCATCREPWDTYHLRHDEPWEYGDWTGWSGEIPLRLWRDRAGKAGWRFGSSVLVIYHCPACPTDAETNEELGATRDTLADLLGDDEDAIAVMFEDLGEDGPLWDE